MKWRVLTVRQPHATLMALGVKLIETRGWSTTHRGPFAVHAGLKFGDEEYELCQRAPIKRVLDKHEIPYNKLPLGQILSISNLLDCVRMPAGIDVSEPVEIRGVWLPPDEPERSFGAYAPRRVAWVTDTPYALPIPVTVTGARGLWTLDDETTKVLERRLVGTPYDAMRQPWAR